MRNAGGTTRGISETVISPATLAVRAERNNVESKHERPKFILSAGGRAQGKGIAETTSSQIAASLVSPVRMRITWSTSLTKILPSPILPVRAAFTIASIALSRRFSGTTTSTLTLGRKSTTTSAPR